MPLLVHCPNNCQIRLPSNRMGKVVRCLECQTPIRIPELDSPLLRTGNWVECRAKRAIKKTDQNNNTHDIDNQTPLSCLPVQATPAPNGPETTGAPSSALNAALPPTPPPQNARLLRAKPWRMVEPLTSVDPETCLTPLDLELTSANPTPPPTMPSQAQEGSAPNLEFNQQRAKIDHGGTADWFSTIRKLLWYEPPADKKPPQSV